MLVIGLTGNIGSGKSTVAAILQELGATVLDADRIARQVVQPGTPALAEIVRTFGPGILAADGQLNRPAMAGIVFSNSAARQQLEAIIHPRVKEYIDRAIQEQRKLATPPPALVIEVPLLFEAGMQNMMDEVWLVTADEQTRLDRIRQRDRVSEEVARQRMAAQMPQEQKIPLADRIIDNSGAPQKTREQVTKAWQDAIFTRSHRAGNHP
ncbi:dephospho-CoA kinase [Desulfurispora thermophila]|uniref:dephospho-CoA kinase n=1 Tax=Desulfurispora thermophila TaxID=265470 RepID=UPI00037EDF18|nr:dephospho-CoA kinase [Desulfurispora thermophila]